MNKRKIIFTLFFIQSIYLFSQTLTGFVKDDAYLPLSGVSVTVTDSLRNILSYGFTDKKGFFLIKNDVGNNYKFIELKKNGYESLIIENKHFKNSQTHFLAKLNELQEVLIISKKNPLRIKKDTIEYNVKSFKQGDEKNVEDLLKKLPGISVAESGEIKFKGKSIEKLLIDGSDILDRNYTIGTRNISVDMLDKVEAINHFSENSVINQIEKSNNVALNLKLKEGKTDFSVNSSLGLGYKEKYSYHITLLNFSKKNKNISVFQYNNIGKNDSQFDFINFTSFENILEEDKNNILIQFPFLYYPNINVTSLYKNNTFVNSINDSFSLDSNKNVLINLNFSKDHLITNNYTNETLYINNNVIENNISNEIIKKPSVLSANVKYSQNSKKANLTFSSMIEEWDIKDNLVFQSKSNHNNFNIKSNNLDAIINLNYSYLLKENLALVYNSKFYFNKMDQNLNFENKTLFNGFYIQNQLLNTSKKNIINEIGLIGKKNNFNYRFFLNYKYLQESLNSSMKDINSIGNINFNDYFFNDFTISSEIKFPYKKIIVSNGFDITYNKVVSLNKPLFGFNINVKYLVNKNSSIYIKYDNKYYYFNHYDFYDNFILENNLFASKKINDRKFNNLEKFQFNFKHYNLLKEYNIEFTINYNIHDYSIINSFSFDENSEILALTTYYNDKNNNHTINSFLKFDFNINKLKLKLYTLNNVFQNNYYTLNDEKTIRSKALTFTNKIEFLTLFTKKLNFSYGIKNNIYKNNLKSSYSVLNSINAIYTPSKKLFLKITNNLLYFDILSNYNHSYLADFHVDYKIGKSNGLSLVINNITNEKRINRTIINEISDTQVGQMLLPTSCIISYSFKF